MSEFEDRLNSLLNDPEQLGRIADMAKNLMGSGESEPEPPAASVSSPLPEGLDPGMLTNMARMFSGMNQKDDQNMALLEAMKPFLAEKRRNKMDRAMKLAKMAKMAELAFGAFGGKIP